MKTTRKYLIALAVIVVPLLGTWVYNEKNSSQAQSAAAAGSRSPADGKAADRGAPRPGKKEIREKAHEWQKRLLAERPEMAIDYREVAAQDNGYLQWLDFMEECRANGTISGNSFNLPEEISGMIGGKLPWDAARFGKWLEENRGMVDRIVALGLLPDQSMAGIDTGRIAWNSGLPDNLAAILLARARHGLGSGDSSVAIESLESMLGSARHMEDIEAPTYLAMVTAVGLRARMLEFASGDEIAAADPETLRQLRELIAEDRPEDLDFARFARGDWQIMSENYLLPSLLGESKLMSDVPPAFLKQPELVAASYADASAALARHWEDATLRELLAPLPDRNVTVPVGLSEEDRGHFEMLTHGLMEGLPKAWALQQVENAMTDAVLAISLGEEVPLEPVTGKPFVIDEATGTLKLPDDPVFTDVSIMPQKIPGRSK